MSLTQLIANLIAADFEISFRKSVRHLAITVRRRDYAQTIFIDLELLQAGHDTVVFEIERAVNQIENGLGYAPQSDPDRP